ncbi:hypothetical protein F2P81_005140 [Scophthalmus maximus]|uniref:Uncharacterized protein n=1 Tax=Scophthalmus maximus TaxID=52904 RepID=A0A6A4TB13_SCOMX|nr:hypothetical protein F2P81_005140 [Scophthalmus maximus]
MYNVEVVTGAGRCETVKPEPADQLDLATQPERLCHGPDRSSGTTVALVTVVRWPELLLVVVVRSSACSAALRHLICFINAPSRPSAASSHSPLWFQPRPVRGLAHLQLYLLAAEL